MKGVLIILDGIGDLPHKMLNEKTPLEAADTPNLDYLASKGELGELYPVKENFVPGTSDGITSILGRDWTKYPRGWLEALGAGIELKRGDLALRANFATIDNLEDKNILDRRAGRTLTTREAEILTKELNEKVNLPCKFIFKNTIQHRGVLVFKGGFSDNITEMDPAHGHQKRKVEAGKMKFSLPEEEDEVTEYSAHILNNFVEQSFKILDSHPINQERRKKGFYPANIILTRAPGTSIDKTKNFERWACSTDVPVIKGICKALGMRLFEFKAVEFKGYDVYQNLSKNLLLSVKNSIKLIKNRKKDFNYFLVYFKETDTAGHDNKPIDKKKMIELIDRKFFSVLRKIAEKDKIKIVVTGDHSTPCKLKQHSTDPVPLLLCDWKGRESKRYNEEESKKGNLGVVYGKDIMRLLN